ncbi:MAG TPA: FtsX-like permease family protein [Polyangiales bacterium]|nr:FtsX-like permease family protein [Polyangiales bacterium]
MTLFGLAARNALRNRFRTGLTVLGVAVAVIAFVLLRTVITSWNIAAEYSAQDRIATRHKQSFVITLPLRYVENIREVKGIKDATWMNWFGGKDPKTPDEFFANFAADAKSFLTVFDEVQLPEEQKQKWLEDRQGAIFGSSLANKLGLKVGDRYTLSGTIFPGDWVFNVDGIYTSNRKSFDQSSMIFHWQLVNETLQGRLRDQVGWVASRVDGPGMGADVSAQIDKIFDQYDTQTITMSERAMNLSFLGMFSAVLKAIDVVSIIILLILTMILANTIAMGVRERTSEYGALRALGFTPGHIRYFIIGESITVGLIAGLIGVAIAWPLVNNGMAAVIEENMGAMFPYFRIEPTTIAIALLLALALGALSGLVPAIQAGRLSVVNALRRVE